MCVYECVCVCALRRKLGRDIHIKPHLYTGLCPVLMLSAQLLLTYDDSESEAEEFY